MIFAAGAVVALPASIGAEFERLQVVALWGVSGREFHKNLWGISRQAPCPNQRNAPRSTSSFRRDNCSRIPQCSYSNIKARRDMLWRIRPAWLFLPTIDPQHASNLRRIHYRRLSQMWRPCSRWEQCIVANASRSASAKCPHSETGHATPHPAQIWR